MSGPRRRWARRMSIQLIFGAQQKLAAGAVRRGRGEVSDRAHVTSCSGGQRRNHGRVLLRSPPGTRYPVGEIWKLIFFHPIEILSPLHLHRGRRWISEVLRD